MSTFTYEGIEFNLALPHSDCTGVVWKHTGVWLNGEPLLAGDSRDGHRISGPLQFSIVYWDHGPLIPISPKPPIMSGLEADVADGFVEGFHDYDVRLAGTGA